MSDPLDECGFIDREMGHSSLATVALVELRWLRVRSSRRRRDRVDNVGSRGGGEG